MTLEHALVLLGVASGIVSLFATRIEHGVLVRRVARLERQMDRRNDANDAADED